MAYGMNFALRLFLLLSLAACGSDRNRGPSSNQSDAAVDAEAGLQDAQPRPDIFVPRDSGPNLADVLVYAHSNVDLYSFSPENSKVETIGTFFLSGGGPVENMLDIAIDAEGELIGVSRNYLYAVNKETAEVTEIGELSTAGTADITGLVFVPEAMFRGTETLVGADNEGAVFEIDRNTAQATEIGFYPDEWVSSGDLVSVAGLGTYATVKKKGAEFDQLVSVTFGSDGVSRMELLGPVSGGGRDYKQLFGIAYWGADIYGFSFDGELLEIDRETAQARLVSSDTGAESFWGAGVTTQVPVIR